MKICITAKTPSPLSEMDYSFEKCAYFTFFVDESMGFEATINDNENNPVQLLINKGVNILITKDISLQQMNLLKQANINIFTDSSGLITDALIKFQNGELKPLTKTDISSNLQMNENNIMKVAISTDGDFVSTSFERCTSFTIADIMDSKILTKEIIINPGKHPGYLQEFLQAKGAEYIVAGEIEENARMLFDEKNIKTFMGISGKVDEVLRQICNGTLK